MGACDQGDPLNKALRELAALGSVSDRGIIASLQDRLSSRRLRVLVAGEAKRGKSTLVNALLGKPVLPTGVVPLTALPTTVRHAHREAVIAAFSGGRTREYPIAALDDLVTERGNPGNTRQLTSVTVQVAAPLLARGIELVDTPGVGSVHAHNTAEAEAAIEGMDAAIFVLTSDPPVSASERELIATVVARSVAMFVVMNKVDRLAGVELAEVLAFTRDVVSEVAGRKVAIYPMSARGALEPRGDAGFDAFATEFTAYLDSDGASDLRRSAAKHARRIATWLRDEVVLARRAGDMRGAQAAERVTAFSARLAAVHEKRRQAADLVEAESKRMLLQLNDAADAAARDSTRQINRQIADLLARDLGDSPAGEIERTGRARLAALAVTAAEAWRSERAGVLEAALAELDDTLTEVLRAELDAVREAAAELLELDLTVAVPGGRLAPDRRFFYVAGEQAGQTELLAGSIRRRLPGEAGRKRAREYLRREAGDLVPQQIGRARADLQYRLAEASRRLAREIGARYEDGTGRLEKALANSAGLRNATSQEVEARDTELRRRLAAIGDVLAMLNGAAGHPVTAKLWVSPE